MVFHLELKGLQEQNTYKMTGNCKNLSKSTKIVAMLILDLQFGKSMLFTALEYAKNVFLLHFSLTWSKQ
jgi:hypothetical protein